MVLFKVQNGSKNVIRKKTHRRSSVISDFYFCW